MLPALGANHAGAKDPLNKPLLWLVRVGALCAPRIFPAFYAWKMVAHPCATREALLIQSFPHEQHALPGNAPQVEFELAGRALRVYVKPLHDAEGQRLLKRLRRALRRLPRPSIRTQRVRSLQIFLRAVLAVTRRAHGRRS